MNHGYPLSHFKPNLNTIPHLSKNTYAKWEKRKTQNHRKWYRQSSAWMRWLRKLPPNKRLWDPWILMRRRNQLVKAVWVKLLNLIKNYCFSQLVIRPNLKSIKRHLSSLGKGKSKKKMNISLSRILIRKNARTQNRKHKMLNLRKIYSKPQRKSKKPQKKSYRKP